MENLEPVLVQLLELSTFLPEDKKIEFNALLQQVASAAQVNLGINTETGAVSDALQEEQEIINSWRREKEEEHRREQERLENERKAEIERAELERQEQQQQQQREREQREREQRERESARTRAVELKPASTTPRTASPTPKAAAGSSAGGEVDLSDPAIADAVQQVRDLLPTSWLTIGYGNERKKLSLYQSGEGGIAEVKAALAAYPGEIQYCLVRLLYGDSDRAKYVFITYVPESLSGMAKAKANMHKPYVDAFFQYFHTYLSATSLDDITETIIYDKLTRAAGANYGTGRNFSGVKGQSKNFFSETEKQGTLGSVVYDKGPIKHGITEANLAARPGLALDTYKNK